MKTRKAKTISLCVYVCILFPFRGKKFYFTRQYVKGEISLKYIKNLN